MTLSEKPLLKALKKISKLYNKREKQQRKCKHKNKEYFSTNAATTIYCKKCKKIFFIFQTLPDDFSDNIIRKEKKIKKPRSSNLPSKPSE